MDLSTDVENTGHIGVGPLPFPVPNIRLQPFDGKIISPIKNVSTEKPIINLVFLNIFLE